MTPEVKAIDERQRLAERSQELCLALLRTDISLAYSFLRLAHTELKLGAASHAAELIEQATTAYDHVVEHLEQSPFGSGQERRILERDARELFEAIAAHLRAAWQPDRR